MRAHAPLAVHSIVLAVQIAFESVKDVLLVFFFLKLFLLRSLLGEKGRQSWKLCTFSYVWTVLWPCAVHSGTMVCSRVYVFCTLGHEHHAKRFLEESREEVMCHPVKERLGVEVTDVMWSESLF